MYKEQKAPIFLHEVQEHSSKLRNYGHKALWRAVILQAFIDSVSNCKRTESKLAKVSAKSWLLDMGYNFKLVCNMANYDPHYVHDQAMKFIKENKNISVVLNLRKLKRKAYYC